MTLIIVMCQLNNNIYTIIIMSLSRSRLITTNVLKYANNRYILTRNIKTNKLHNKEYMQNDINELKEEITKINNNVNKILNKIDETKPNHSGLYFFMSFIVFVSIFGGAR